MSAVISLSAQRPDQLAGEGGRVRSHRGPGRRQEASLTAALRFLADAPRVLFSVYVWAAASRGHMSPPKERRR